MAKIKPMVGLRFGRLVAVAEAGMGPRGMVYTYKCDCGNTKDIFGSLVRNGKVLSCGCLRSETTAKKNTTHGMFRTPTYHTWMGMKNRCLNENQPAFKNYGERGISICEEWMEFDGFLADMGERPDGHTLERIDNSKGYSKDNCTWATCEQQSRNTRQNKFITYDGKTMCMMDWSKETGIPYATIQDRRRKGLAASQILARAR